MLLSLAAGATSWVAAGCGGAPEDGDAPDAAELEPIAEAELEGRQQQGRQQQGTLLSGFPDGTLVDFLYAGATLNGSTLSNLRVEGGWLAAGPVVTTGASLKPCTSTTYGVSRNCGWRAAATATCTPGKTVAIGAGGCGLGSCTGNSMLRVCAGTTGCDAVAALASNDNASCGGSCSYVKLACPAGGKLTILVGAYDSSAWAGATLKATTTAGATVSLTPIRHGPELKGARLKALSSTGTSLLYAIQSVKGPYAGGSTFRYDLDRIHPATGASIGDACVPHPATGDAKAVPIAARWNPDSLAREESTTRFTMACSSGAIGKCYDWGYRPFMSSVIRDTHQACTRMVRGDYCGDGESHTYDGTEINVWDENISPAIQVKTSGLGMYFEAGWKPDGAVCLSKLRWKNLCTDFCPGKLVTPAFIQSGGFCELNPQQPPGAAICDESQEVKTKFDPTATLFNESYINDVP